MKSTIFTLVSLVLLLGIVNLSIAGNIVGKVTAKGAKNSADAVIYIDSVAGKTFAPPKDHPKMDQKNLAFDPHVIPVLAGTTVDFVNSDKVLHNVFSPDQCCGKFNLGSWPQGQSKSYTFPTAGCNATLLCNVHPEMEGFVVVLGTPYYAVSAKDGTFRIKDVPPGKYTLKIWHEKLKGSDVPVVINAAGDDTVNFTIHK
jgi:plastocyanin